MEWKNMERFVGVQVRLSDYAAGRCAEGSALAGGSIAAWLDNTAGVVALAPLSAVLMRAGSVL
jgi:hypothetical protein